MWPAINFNDKVFLYADKIDNKGTNMMLPPEFPAVKFLIPQMTPQQPFGISHAFSQGPGALVGHEPPLTPALSPLRGEGVLGNWLRHKQTLSG
jgi:hypothetical protein